jgi:glycosyltransferase involved in cell wall biosynthesis
VQVPLLTIVHDLRWRRTRSKVGAAYRAWDLRRSVLHSDALLCISDKTRRDLTDFIPRATATAAVQWLGPGQVPEGSFRDSQSGMLMLIGDAPHKRNELAAAALASARPPWVRGIIGVGVSERVRAILSKEFACEWFEGISDAEMLKLYQRAQFFLMLGTDEGFGLPFVEALAAGCQVVAMDHPLAREVLGSAGLLVTSGSAATIGEQLLSQPSVPASERAAHAQLFSWKVYGEACESKLAQLAKTCRS